MKKILKIFLGLFVFVLVALVILMFAIGKDYRFERKIYINAPVDKVWPHINSMKAINAWSPFLKMDPQMQQKYSGPSGEVGDTYYWNGNEQAGEGEERIVKLDPLHSSEVELHFIRPFESHAHSGIILEPKGNGTEVTWNFSTEMEYPFNLMKLFMDAGMDEAFTDGLQSLKKMAEQP